MTREEYDRLSELDKIIAYNNSTDKGRSLNEEEKKEHSDLIWRLLAGENVED